MVSADKRGIPTCFSNRFICFITAVGETNNFSAAFEEATGLYDLNKSVQLFVHSTNLLLYKPIVDTMLTYLNFRIKFSNCNIRAGKSRLIIGLANLLLERNIYYGNSRQGRFITGASAGIGLATVRSFAAAGAKLALVARSTDALNHLAKELQSQGIDAVALPADVSDPRQVERVIEETVRRFGRLDVVINNVGQAVVGKVADLNPDDFRKILDLNVLGPLVAMQSAIPVMREQGGGLIINISSVVSKMHIGGLGAYAATKAALNMISDTARDELASNQIRVITVYPRSTATDFGKTLLVLASSSGKDLLLQEILLKWLQRKSWLQLYMSQTSNIWLNELLLYFHKGMRYAAYEKSRPFRWSTSFLLSG